MKRLLNGLKRFFFPPTGSPAWRRVLPYAILGVLTIIVLAGANYGWEYTNSPAFCGTACHTMPPEYVAYQISPHARVACVDCHLGRDTFTRTFGRKAGDLRHVIFYWGKNYEVPIYATSMRPASASCEKCHWPEKFSNDKVRAIQRFSTDDKNSATQISLVMHTGGGSSRVGLGRGIHWHIESAGGSKVEYYATDELKQSIPYVRVTDANGKVTEYFDTEAQVSRDQVQAAAQKGELKQIDPGIPSIKAKGLEVFAGKYQSINQALAVFDGLTDFYQAQYPDYAAKNQDRIKAAITQLKTLYQESVFPGMEVNWDTHPDNLGHREFPGCFRCHDGKHTTDNGSTIRLECNVCHTLPKEALPGQPAPVVVLGVPAEPDSHKDTNWMFKHQTALDQTCAGCHDTKNAGLATNDSFCSNAACHGVDWRFAGLNAPGLRAKMGATQPQPTPQPAAAEPASPALPAATPAAPAGGGTPPAVPHDLAGRDNCLMCHNPDGGVKPAPEDHAGRTNDMCQTCHKPSTSASPTTAPAAAPTTAATAIPAAASGGEAPPAIPHDLAGRDNCLMCHNPDGGVKPAPKDHAGRTNETCQACHKPKT